MIIEWRKEDVNAVNTEILAIISLKAMGKSHEYCKQLYQWVTL